MRKPILARLRSVVMGGKLNFQQMKGGGLWQLGQSLTCQLAQANKKIVARRYFSAEPELKKTMRFRMPREGALAVGLSHGGVAEAAVLTKCSKAVTRLLSWWLLALQGGSRVVSLAGQPWPVLDVEGGTSLVFGIC
ncbi:hypothetical protein F2P56_033449 [Juglans regia]|uniref:Uncharacterized protein n=2 Tax=Juglans regia TaxID=51240 RepID=A0A833TWM7_JUGRE|nr:uncharacterized protein LOC109001705 isoform X2 [Juglans regia]KAF5447934.1 hypothetical protein F2P56_033449 [Juglans regia]